MATPSGAVVGAAALLERSVTYMLGNLVLVTPKALTLPTPCEGWDLRALLGHVEDALIALTEAIYVGRVSLPGPVQLNAVRRAEPLDTAETATSRYAESLRATEINEDPIEGVRTAARHVIAAWSAATGSSASGSAASARAPVTIGWMPVSAALVAAAGGIEIAAHGWDIARALGWRRPVPASLAEEMLDLLPLLLTDGSRGQMYAAAVAVPTHACAGDKLIAYLGRRPPDAVERRYLQSRAAMLLTAGPS